MWPKQVTRAAQACCLVSKLEGHFIDPQGSPGFAPPPRVLLVAPAHGWKGPNFGWRKPSQHSTRAITAPAVLEDPRAVSEDLPGTCLENRGFGSGSAPSAWAHLAKRCPDAMVTGSAGINTEHGCGLFA